MKQVDLNGIEMIEKRKKVLITIHGIRTFGEWQKRLKRMTIDADQDVIVETYAYGYFNALAFVLPPFRWLAVRTFRNSLQRLFADHGDADYSIVSHSFGTHIAAYALHRWKGDNPEIHTILTSGSVLKSNFDWTNIVRRFSVKQIVNDCGTSDNILLLSQFFVLFTGMAGRIGFNGFSNEKIINRYFKGGHSHYFENASDDVDGFMREWWLPLLAQDIPPQEHDERQSPTAIDGLVHTFMQFADPVKICAYLGILYPAYYYGVALPREHVRVATLRADSVAHINIARRSLESGKILDAMKHALAALPNDLSNPKRPYIRDAELILARSVARRCDSVVDLVGHTKLINDASFHLETNRVVTASEDCTARIWNSSTLQLEALLVGHSGPIRSVDFSPDGTRVATASADDTIKIWDANEGILLLNIPRTQHKNFVMREFIQSLGGVDSVKFTPDGQRLLSEAWDGLELHDVSSGKSIFSSQLRFEPNPRWPSPERFTARFNDNEPQMVTSSSLYGFEPEGLHQPVVVINTQSGDILSTLDRPSVSLLDAVFTPDNNIITADYDGPLRIFNSTTGAQIAKLDRGNEDILSTFNISQNKNDIVIGTKSGSIEVWSLLTKKMKIKFQASSGPIIRILNGAGLNELTLVSYFAIESDEINLAHNGSTQLDSEDDRGKEEVSVWTLQGKKVKVLSTHIVPSIEKLEKASLFETTEVGAWRRPRVVINTMIGKALRLHMPNIRVPTILNINTWQPMPQSPQYVTSLLYGSTFVEAQIKAGNSSTRKIRFGLSDAGKRPGRWNKHEVPLDHVLNGGVIFSKDRTRRLVVASDARTATLWADENSSRAISKTFGPHSFNQARLWDGNDEITYFPGLSEIGSHDFQVGFSNNGSFIHIGTTIGNQRDVIKILNLPSGQELINLGRDQIASKEFPMDIVSKD